MLIVNNLIIEDVESTFTGSILLHFNTGGIVGTEKVGNKVIKFYKTDSVQPIRSILDRPKST